MKIGRRQLLRIARLRSEDLRQIRKRRRDYNRLGFGYQLTFIRFFNRVPHQVPFEVNQDVLTYVASYLKLNTEIIDTYQKRQPTISDHQTELLEYLELKKYDNAASDQLKEFLFKQSLRVEHTVALESLASQFLRDVKVLEPGKTVVAKCITEQRSKARNYIFSTIASTVTVEMAEQLGSLIETEDGVQITPLQKLKVNPKKPSPDAMIQLLHKIETIEDMKVLSIDISWLNRNYQRTLYHYIKRSTPYRISNLTIQRKIASLVCFLHQAHQDAIDQAVDMFHKIITLVSTRASRDIDEAMKQQKKMFRTSANLTLNVAQLLLDSTLNAEEKVRKIFDLYPEEELQDLVNQTTEWVSGKHSHSFFQVVKRFSYLRRFSPLFLKTLDFSTEGEESSCWQAIETLRELNQDNNRKLPEKVTTDFISRTLKPVIVGDDGIDRKAWECALLLKLKEEIKVGNIYVNKSKRFGQFDEYLIPESQWESAREAFFAKAGLPSNPQEVASQLTQKLDNAYNQFFASAAQEQGIKFDADKWQLVSDESKTLSNEQEEELKKLRRWLSQKMRKIRLPDLLIEVDNQLGFTRHFLPNAQKRKPQDVCAILATIMAHGCNIGLYTMESLIEGVSYHQLRRISDWQITPEAQRQALGKIANSISSLDISMYWGEGRTSASDGQRFAYPRKQLQQTYSTKFGDFALEFYSFIADNYAPFFSTPIECQERDAPYVIDGLLYNESELELEEHYTDTHGYTEINFAAFAMLGRRFCPRIRGLKSQSLYRIDPERDYGVLQNYFTRSDKTINLTSIVEQWDKMGRFYASLEAGHTTASMALKRLVSYPRKNLFFRANQDLGRIFKTSFLLKYMTEPKLRQRIRRGLLKVEELHQLARDICYAKRGRIGAREIHQQMNTCSSLTLLAACVIYWQAQEITNILKSNKIEAEMFDPSLLAHISPIGWDNVILYGEYKLNPKLIR